MIINTDPASWLAESRTLLPMVGGSTEIVLVGTAHSDNIRRDSDSERRRIGQRVKVRKDHCLPKQ